MTEPKIPDEFRRALAASGNMAVPLALVSEGLYSLEYVPFDHVKTDAKLVIVGITPGPTQRDDAYDEIGKLLRRGLPDKEILRDVKKYAAFGGRFMRPNLERMIDVLGIMDLFGGGRAAELWQAQAHLLHATSVVPHAAFVGRKPFAGSFEQIQRIGLLRRCFERDFLSTLSLLRRDAYYVGLGPTPAAALSFAADNGIIGASKILGWLAHPSSQGGSQVSVYLGEKTIDDLNERDPVRSRASVLAAAAEDLRLRLKAAQI